MEIVILGILLAIGLVIILALVGLVHTITWFAHRGQRQRAFTPPPLPPDPSMLSRAQKLMVVEETLGPDMPAHLAAELRALMPWRYPPEPASASSAEPGVTPWPVPSSPPPVEPAVVTGAAAPVVAPAEAALPATPAPL